MVSQTSVSIRMDRDLKTAFNDFCSDMGISMTTAFNLFARKTVSEYRIPFDVGDSLPYEGESLSRKNVYGCR